VPNDAPADPDKARHPATIEPLLIPDTEAARLAGCSRSHWQRLIVAGRVPAPIRLGRRVLWRRADVIAWIEASCPDRRTWEVMQQQARRLRLAM
jgi:excisionase family DNA binding protein